MPAAKYRVPESIVVGDLVYLHSDRNKSKARDRYIVVQVEGTFCNLKKFVGSQLRNTSYRVKTSECYRIASDCRISTPPEFEDDCSSTNDDEQDRSVTPILPPVPPPIPSAISIPPNLQQSVSVEHENLPQHSTDADYTNFEHKQSSELESSVNGCNGPSAYMQHGYPELQQSTGLESTMNDLQSQVNPPLRRSTLLRRMPDHFGDFVMDK